MFALPYGTTLIDTSYRPMNMESAHKRGFCPRVWTPMESGDGLIVRVHPGLSEIAAEKLHSLVLLAEKHGNGQIDVTRRANLQLRGIAAEQLTALQTALVASTWAAPNQAGERHFALLTSPLLGLADESAPLLALARELERGLLLSDAAPAWLHPKLCIAVDDAEQRLRASPFDLAIAPITGEPLRVRLTVRDEAHRPCVLGSCASEDAVTLVLCVIGLLSARATRPLRMHEWAAAFGLEALRTALSPKLVREDEGLGDDVQPASLVGFQQRTRSWFGLLFPFGSGSAAQWRAALALSTRFGGGTLRVTPAREVLLLDVPETARAALLQAAKAAGFVCSTRDPLLHVSACTGAPLCAAAHGETRILARALAESARPFLMQGARLHVSGCTKSCAHSGPSEFTVVHDQDGLHLARGKGAAEAARTPVLSQDEARAALTAFAREYATCSRATPGALGARKVDAREPLTDSEQREMTRHYDYERDGAEIYRRSFAQIRAEAELARFTPVEERVAVRLIHTSGMVDLAQDIHFSAGFVEAAQAALARGAPILCDANMVASGVTRARLTHKNDILCFLDAPGLAYLAQRENNTRSAAAVTLWKDKLDGALVAIGNAPTALFRLLELFDEQGARPAAVIGVPVGFVGAAEAKEALLADGRVPALIVRGRRGGSAMAVAAINALASDKE